jgi:hypothetical protein
MPKRKVAPPTANYPWLDGELSIGEIILSMAQELLIEKQNQPNQLAAQLGIYLDGQDREAEFVRRVNSAFAEQELYFERQRKAGKAQENNSAFNRIVKCYESLVAKGEPPLKITAPQIEKEWGELKFGTCNERSSIRAHLRTIKNAKP